MKVLLNLVSPNATLNKKTVTDWVLQYLHEHKDDTCFIITSQLLPATHSNIEQTMVKPPQNNTAFQIWKKLTLEPMIRKQDCGLVITWDMARPGVSAKQVLIASPINPGVLSNDGSKRKPALKMLEKVKEQCKQIVVFSALEQNWIISNYPHLAGLTQVIRRGTSAPGTNIAFDDRESMKNNYSDGNEFFIAPAGVGMETLTVMLKGFSGFKKWQKSSMELLLSYDSDDAAAAIRKLLERYRFHESIKLISTEDQNFSKVLASAYAAILPDKWDSDFSFLFTSMRSGVPVLIPKESIYSEVTGEAAFEYASNEKESITKVLLQIFKEERERSRKIEIGVALMGKWKTYNPSQELFINI